jgi:hypothetical protein
MKKYGEIALIALMVLWVAPKIPVIKDLLPQANKA